MPEFRRGAETAEASSEAAKSGGRAQFLQIPDKAKNPTIIRLLTEYDRWIDCENHMGVPTKPAPEGFSGNWPSKMGAICQNDSMFREMQDGDLPGKPTGSYEPGYGHCYIHEHMQDVMGQFGTSVAVAKPRVWALCVVRETVRDPDTKKIVGFRDKTEEWADKTGTKHTIPMIRILSQAYGNFFGAIKQSAWVDEQVCHRDFVITRSANDYDITPLDPTPNHKPGTPSWQVYTDALELTGISLEDTIVGQSSPEYYARFFDPTKQAPKDSGGNGSGGTPVSDAPADTSAPDGEVDPDELAEFRSRIDKSFSDTTGASDG